MTTQEFSNQFDLLYNNIMSNQAPGIDEYEKSVFLTKAQDEVLKAYFDPRGNKFSEGFDDSAKRQIDFSNVIRVNNTEGAASSSPFGAAEFDAHSNSKSVTLPSDILVIINESVTVLRNTTTTVVLKVIPINHQEYDRLTSKPFKRPLNYQAWRLINSSSSGSTITRKSDLVIGPSDTLGGAGTKYSIRYVKKPSPIILVDLSSEGLSIDGTTAITQCELDSILHPEILQRAVELAKAAYTGDLNSQLALGQASETNMGVVATSK